MSKTLLQLKYEKDTGFPSITNDCKYFYLYVDWLEKQIKSLEEYKWMYEDLNK